MKRYSVVLLIALLHYPLVGQAQNVDTTTPKRAAATFDERLFISINHWGKASPSLDGPMEFMSNSITYTMIGVPAVLVGVGLVQKDRAMTSAGIGVASGELIAGIATFGLKNLFERPRPYHVLENVRTPGNGSGGFSFPSGHSSMSWAIATGLMIHYPKWYVIAPSVAYATIVSLSRPYLGVHYPSDLFVGALVGVGSAFLGREIERQIVKAAPGILPREEVAVGAANKRSKPPVTITWSIPIP